MSVDGIIKAILITISKNADDEEDIPSEFVFVPSIGCLMPGQTASVEVTFKPSECRRVRTAFQCQAESGKTRCVISLSFFPLS